MKVLAIAALLGHLSARHIADRSYLLSLADEVEAEEAEAKAAEQEELR